jgi:hypothetical protein
MDTVMIAWVVGVPLALMLMVLALDRLETNVVAPIDRADRISKLMDIAEPEELEESVSILLAPVARGPSRSRGPAN